MKIKSLLTVAALSFATATAHAAAGDVSLGLKAGLGLPIGDFKDVAATGFHIGATGDYALNDRFSLGGDLVYHTFGGNDDLEKALSATLGQSVDFKFSIIQVTPHLRFSLPTEGTLAPYVQLGLGLYRSTGKSDPGGSDSSTPFGFHIGVGADIKKAESYTYGFSGEFHQISSSDASGDKSANLITVGVHAGFGLK